MPILERTIYIECREPRFEIEATHVVEYSDIDDDLYVDDSYVAVNGVRSFDLPYTSQALAQYFANERAGVA
ncbi:hypothetical protein C7405_101679 [Paraburkholderia caballeronis]|uniref:hypothetical protein n=1 Tax=Paraburkholderia caballeronis TaxID=416943 RepID=UPI00106576A8|nr:hypothetical protein [Paraburkholderia caballeronis]TDV39560.1 hypothetical protein C7405_101679 [Paraburkholderia caballeronis]